MKQARLVVGVVVALGCGCAQIRTTSTVEVIPKAGAAAVVFGAPASAITARGATASWTQRGDSIEFEVHATRQCAVLRHDPVVRVEHITRKSGGAVYWEFGIGAALLAGGLTGLIRPELFGQRQVNASGETARDTAPGYRLGGILTALSAVAIGAGIFDVARTRDEVRYTDAYRPHLGEPGECDEPQRPLAGRTLEVIVGDWQSSAIADEHGRIRVSLPAHDSVAVPEADPRSNTLAPAVVDALRQGTFFDPERMADTEAAGGPRVEVIQDDDGRVTLVPEAQTVYGVLRLGGRDALRFDFVVPYASPKADGHHGQIVIAPQPVRRAPPLPQNQPADPDSTPALAPAAATP